MKTTEQRLKDLCTRKLGLFPRELVQALDTDFDIQMTHKDINAWLVYNGYQTRAERRTEDSDVVFGTAKYFGFHRVPVEVENAGWAVYYGETDDACWHPDICELIAKDKEN